MGKGQSFDRARFVANVADNKHLSEAVRNAIFELLDFAEKNAEEVRGGSAKFGSFHYAISIANRIVNLFTCDSSGYVSTSLGSFQQLVRNKTLKRFSSRLIDIPGIEENVRKYHTRPGFSINKTIVDPKMMSRYQSAILRFQADIDEE